MSADFHHHLFEFSSQVTPYLKGEVRQPLPKEITLYQDCGKQVHALYQQLAETSPEAGKAYWMTRTWDLLTWQPVYVAFVSIYGLQTLPNLRDISQEVHDTYIAGYSFPNASHHHGEVNDLIKMAGEALNDLFDFYLEQMNQFIRIRPGNSQHLIADLVLGCLIKMQGFRPELNHEYLVEQAQLWFDALNLPSKPIQGLIPSEDNKSVLTRTSCCLVYKCKGASLCEDCPRK
ncbi:siderophore ferric iron reductase [Vibrio mexicanus]|uniref:siderophore ferric iron reductase n=1 Tax=Vibrio mexicanus TaxID=1004326 RepID=UPI00063C8E92|nr:siderophore ferric iron reductase [Vibrio mexicanus]